MIILDRCMNETTPKRCEFVSAGHRCERTADHDGPHVGLLPMTTFAALERIADALETIAGVLESGSVSVEVREMPE